MNSTAHTSPPTNLPAPEPRLRRSLNGSVGGVAQGLATFFGVEAKWIRLAFLASVLFGGVGFLAYIAAWLGLPDENDPRGAKFAVTQSVGRLVVAGIFAVFAMGSISGAAAISSGLLLPALLVGGGVYLLSQNNSDTTVPTVGGQYPKAHDPAAPVGMTPPPPQTPVHPQPPHASAPPHAATPPQTEAPTPEPEVVDDRDPLLIEAERLMSGEAYLKNEGTPQLPTEPAHWALTRTEQAELTARKRRPPIVPFALGAAGLVSFLMLTTGAEAPFFAYAFIFMGFAAAGFVASLVFRRPAWALIPIALLSFGSAMIGLFADEVIVDGIGEANFELVDLELPPVPAVPDAPGVPSVDEDAEFIELFDHGIGEMNVRLDDLSVNRDVTIVADLGIGELDIDLPDNLRTELVLDGETVTFPNGESRSFSDDTILILNDELDGPTVRVIADLGIGELLVDANFDEFTIQR